MDRKKQIQVRQWKIHRGAAAETALQHLDGTFNEVRETVIDDIVKNTMATMEVDTYSVFLLTALTEMRRRLEEQIKTGHKAAEARRKEIEQNAGGSDI